MPCLCSDKKEKVGSDKKEKVGSDKKEKVKKDKDNNERKEVVEEKIIKEKAKRIKAEKEKEEKEKKAEKKKKNKEKKDKDKKNKEKKEKDKKNKEKKGKKENSKSDHSSSSPHGGVGSPSSGAIGKVTSASSSLSSASTATAAEAAATSKVRVTFFESEKPHVVVGSPEPLTFDPTDDLLSLPLDAQGLASGSQQQQQLLLLATSTMTSPSPITVPPYDRQTSTDSGWDNPFRPDGDLSREADEIVELIKGGKPITPTPGSVAPPLPEVGDTTDGAPSTPPGVHSVEKSTPVALSNSVKPDGVAKPPSSPKGAGTGANGNAAPATTVTPSKGAPSSVEVQRGHVAPGDQCQVEHVVLKKKPKCKCCVIQ